MTPFFRMWAKPCLLIIPLLITFLLLVEGVKGSRSFDDSVSASFRVRQQLAAYRSEVEVALGFHPQGGHVRTKRATIKADDNPLLARQRRKISAGQQGEESWVVREVFRVSPQILDHVRTLDINSFIIGNKSFMASLELDGQSKSQVVVYRLSSGLHAQEIVRKEVEGARTLEVVDIGGTVYLLPLVRSSSNSTDEEGSPLLRLDLSPVALVQVQLIPTPYAKASVFWEGSGEHANSVWLAVAPEANVNNGGVKVEVSVYRWQGGYLDEVSSLSASSPQALEHFSLLNNHFLAVANGMGQNGVTTLHSEVFRYVHREDRFVSFQRIRTYGAKDIRHFSFKRDDGREEHYLAIANHCRKDENGNQNFNVKSVVMKFATRRFVPFKSFPTVGALQFLPVQWGEKFLLVLLEIRRMRVFQFNGWTFVQVKSIDMPDFGSQFYDMRLRQFLLQPYFALSSTAANSRGGLYSVGFEQRNDQSELSAGLEKWCLAAREKLNQISIPTLSNQIDSAPKTHAKDIFLTRPLTFGGPANIISLETQDLTTRGIHFGMELEKKLEDLAKEDVSSTITSLSDRVANAIRRNSSHYINGKIVFDKIEYLNPTMSTVEANISSWNKIDVGRIVDGLLFVNGQVYLDSLRAPSVIVSEMLSAATLNGAPLEDYALKEGGPGVFTRKNVFFNDEVQIGGKIEVTGVISGVNFDKPNFLLAQGNQTLSGPVKITNGHVNNLFTKLLNGDDIQRYIDDAVPKDGDASITASHRWITASAQTVYLGALINGVNVTELLETGIRIKGMESQSFLGTSKFQRLVTNSIEMSPLSKINGRYILSKDFVNTREGNYSFSELILGKGGSVDHLHILRELNKVAVGNGDFGLVLKRSEQKQKIRSKNLHGIHFNEDVETPGLFAGVNLRDWNETQRIALKTTSLSRKFTIFGTLSAPSIQVTKSLIQDGTNLLPLLDHAASLTDKKLPGNCQLVFNDITVEGNTKLSKTVNGHNPAHWLTKDSPPVSVSGTKVFLGNLVLNEDATANSLKGEIKGEDIIASLPNLLLQGHNQTIAGPTEFYQLLKAGILDCEYVSLDGRPFSSLLMASGDQVIQTRTNFKGQVGVKEGLKVENNLYITSFNNYNLNDAITDTLRTKADRTQVIRGQYNFQEGIVVNKLQTDGYVDGINIGNLFVTLVRKDRREPLLIKGSLEFSEGLSSTLVKYDGTLNGIDEKDWGHLWLLSGPNQTVLTPTKISGSLSVHKNVYSGGGTVNGVDVRALNANTVRIDENVKLGVLKLPEMSVRNLQLGPTARVNGINFHKDLLQRNIGSNKSQKISGKKSFKGGLEAQGNLEIKTLDNADINPALRFLYVKDPTAFRKHKLLVLGHLNLRYEPVVRISVNAENLKHLLQNVWFTNEPANVAYVVNFNSLVFNGSSSFAPVKGSGKLNGLSLAHLNSSYISRTRDQTWTGRVTFSDSVSISELGVEDLQSRLLNGRQLSVILKEFLINGTNQTVYSAWDLESLFANQILQNPLKTLVNGLDLDKDIVSLHGPNIFSTPRSLLSLHAQELVLDPSRTVVNSINLTDWKANAVKSKGNNKLNVPLRLNNLGYGKHLIVKGLVDGVNVSKNHLLLLTGPQHIEGPLVVEEDLYAPRGIILSGPLNGEDIGSTLGTLVRKSDTSPVVIESPATFSSPVYAKHIRSHGLIQGKNISRILSQYHGGDVIPPELNFRAKENYEALTAFANVAIDLSQRRAVWLEYFVISQTIEVHGIAYVNLLLSPESPTLTIGQQSGSSLNETWWLYDPIFDMYKRMDSRSALQLSSGRVVDVVEIENDYSPLIAMALNRPRGLSLPRSQNHRDLLKSSKDKSEVVILQKRKASDMWELALTLHGKDFGNMAAVTVTVTNIPCIFVTALNGTSSLGRVLCPSRATTSAPFIQTIQLENPSLVEALDMEHESLVMIVTRGSGIRETLVEVWSHLPQMRDIFFTKKASIPVTNAVSMAAIVGPNPHHNTFLVVASAPTLTQNYLGAVFIYRYTSSGEFEKTQTLDVDSPRQVRLHILKASNELLLFILSNNPLNNLLVYKFHGVSGWSLEHRWTVEGGEGFQVGDFVFEGGLHKAHVIVFGQNRTTVYSALFKGLTHRFDEKYV